MRPRARTLLLLIFSILSAWTVSSRAADSALSVEYRVKAAYLYNFTRFIEWPARAHDTADNGKIAICLLGHDPFGPALDLIAGKAVRNSKLTVRRHKSVGELNKCHVVFISTSKQAELGRILKQLRNRPILTVGETKNFNKLGGVIRFTLVKNKVHFNIDPDAAERAQLTVSSKLLNLATIVRESRP
ncbi:MAG: YfiR family protein [Gammaproteobacteria bacterium]